MSATEGGADRSRTFLLVGVGIVALAALVAFVIVPLLSGGDEDPDVVVDADGDVIVADDDPTPQPTDSDFPLADPSEAAEEGEGDPPEETFEVFNARDPFEQLVDESDEDGGDGTTGGTPTGPDPTDPAPGPPPVTPTTSPSPAPPGTTPTPTASPSPGTPGTGTGDDDDLDNDGDVDEDDGDTNGDGVVDEDDDDSAEVGGTTITLVDVFTDDDGERMATITVNGTAYTVGEGDTFARRFRLLDISGRCTTMLFGDSRFTLCEGEHIRK